jgi:hypothetical protein
MNDAQVITVAGEQITEDEIAGFHVDPVTRGYWLIISSYSHAHGGPSQLDYHVNPGEPGYEETAALYASMFTVTADTEDSEVVYFQARNYKALQALYEYLEEYHYAFTFELGATRHNYLQVFRDQHKIKGRTNRRVWMEKLIKDYATTAPEQEEDE